jgi:hypothetical protein
MGVRGIAVSREMGPQPVNQPDVILRQLRAHVGHQADLLAIGLHAWAPHPLTGKRPLQVRITVGTRVTGPRTAPNVQFEHAAPTLGE